MSDPGAPLGGFRGFIASYIREGLSANRALAAAREAGLGVRRQDWYHAWGEVRAALGRAGDIARSNWSVPVPDDLKTPWSTFRGRGTAVQIEAVTRLPGGGLLTTQYTYVTDALAVVDDALDAFYDDFSIGEEVYGDTVLAAYPVNVFAMVPRR